MDENIPITRRKSLLGLAGLIAAGAGWKLESAEAAGAGPAGVASGTITCVLTPELTEGPYYIAGEKLRRNITDGKPGVPLTLKATVLDASSCKPLKNATVDIWHADTAGDYSGFGAGASSRTFMRGLQKTDAKGVATFQTVYPGWYQGRAVHVHFKVRTYAGAQKTYEFTSQLFFDDSISDTVYRQAPYSSRGARDTRNANDMVYTSNNNSGAMLLANLTQTAAGYHAEFAVGLKIS